MKTDIDTPDPVAALAAMECRCHLEEDCGLGFCYTCYAEDVEENLLEPEPMFLEVARVRAENKTLMEALVAADKFIDGGVDADDQILVNMIRDALADREREEV